MRRWQQASFFYDPYPYPEPSGQVWVQSTDPAIVDWLVDEVQQRDSQSYILETREDADGVTYRIVLQLSPDRDPKVFIPLLKRLLCDQGWEPYGEGTDFKRQA